MRGIFLLALLLVAPVAVAQGSDDLVSLTVEPRVGSIAVGVESPGSFDVDITYDSSSPLDDVQERTIVVDVEGVPDGWTVGVDPAHFQSANHDTRTVTLSVAVSPDAEAKEFDLVVRARLLPRGVSEVPVIGTVLEADETASDTVSILREDPLTREALETIGPWLWLLLAAALVLALVTAKLVYDARRTAVRLHCKVTEATVAPGSRVAIPMRVENMTRVEDTVVFHVAPMPDGWSAHLPVPELDLDGRQSEELHLIVQAPANAHPGSTQKVGVSAHSAQAPKRAAELVLTITVDPNAHPTK